MDVGITGFGVYLPRLRITADEYKKGWGGFGVPGLVEKTVPNFDEDTLTMGVAAGLNALEFTGLDPEKINCLYLASPSLPYAEKSLAATLVNMLGLPETARVGQIGGSANCGGTALLAALDLAAARPGSNVLVIISDAPKAVLGERLEQASGGAAVAFLVGTADVLLSFEGARSVSEEVLGERFRRDGEDYIRDIELKPYTDAAFQRLSLAAVQGLMTDLSLRAEDINYAVLPQFDARTALTLGRKLSLAEEKIKPYLVLPVVGDVGAASSPLGLVNVMDVAVPGERILVSSYGSGAESNALSFIRRQDPPDKSEESFPLNRYLAEKEYVSFMRYLKIKRFFKEN